MGIIGDTAWPQKSTSFSYTSTEGEECLSISPPRQWQTCKAHNFPPRFLTSIQQTCKGYDTCRLKASQRIHFRPSGLAFGRLTAEVSMLFERPSVQRRNVYTSIIPNGDRMRSRLSISVARGEKKEHRLLPVVCVLCEYVCT